MTLERGVPMCIVEFTDLNLLLRGAVLPARPSMLYTAHMLDSGQLLA